MSTRDRNSRNLPPPRPLMPRLPATTSSLRSSPAPRLETATNRTTPSPSVSKRSAPSQAPILSPRLQNGGSTPTTNLVSNITPRSSARRARPDSPKAGPSSAGRQDNDTLSPSLHRSSKLDPGLEAGTSIASPGSAASGRTGPIVSPMGTESANMRSTSALSRAYTSPNVTREAQSPQASDTSPFFFRAGDGLQQARVERPPLQKKKSSFVYADGRRETALPGEEASTAGVNEQKRPGLQSQPRGATYDSSTVRSNRSAASSVTTSSRSQPNGLASPQGFAAIATRSPSPPKFDFHLSYRKGASQVIRPQLSTNNSLASIPSSDEKRRQSSLDTVGEPVPHQARKISTSSLGSHSSPRSPVSDPQPIATKRASIAANPSPLASNFASRTNTTALTKTISDTPTSPPAITTPPLTTAPPVQSPLENPSQPIGQGQDQHHQHHHNRNQSTTALARHERKVLDLEISNSSLLAINRTLEREVRRQKTELRRLRRVTRHHDAARSSWLSDGTSGGGSVGGGVGSLDEFAGLSLGDVEGAGEEDNDVGVEGRLGFLGRQDGDEESDVASTTLSGSDGASLPPSATGALAVSDQKRLRYDLARHKDLLVDSQKMNMGLQRCLAITDQLMADGRRAVEHKVRVEEVEMGGRVLSPEEVEEAVTGVDSLGLDGTDEGEMEREAFEYFDLKRSTGTESTLADEAFGFGSSAGMGVDIGQEPELQGLRRQGSFLLLSPDLAPNAMDGRGRLPSTTLSDMSEMF